MHQEAVIRYQGPPKRASGDVTGNDSVTGVASLAGEAVNDTVGVRSPVHALSHRYVPCFLVHVIPSLHMLHVSAYLYMLPNMHLVQRYA